MLTVSKISSGFRISFPYSAPLVAAIKTLPSRKFDPATKSWIVPSAGAPDLRSLLGRLGDVTYSEGAEAALTAGTEARTEALAASRATDWAGDIPCPEGLAYLPYQRAGIAYCLRAFGDID